MSYFQRLVRFSGGMLLLACGLGYTSPVFAQRADNCPIGASDYGLMTQRTFTDSKGRQAQFYLLLPEAFDPNAKSGILMYFHGNNSDPDNTYAPPLYDFESVAAAHGLVVAGLRSIGTRTGSTGGVVREWVNTDMRLLNELLLSDFGGCLKLDRTRVYLVGESQGTCFLAAVLSDWLWRDFQGGVLGLCGCWGTGEYDYPVNVPTLRNRFKAFVENTTEDFLFDQGVLGLDTYKYNFGVDVRTDLARPGTHCVDSQVNVPQALDWMMKGTSYADPDANQPHWQDVNTQHNNLEDIDYDATGKRFVIAVERAEVTPETLEKNEQVRWNQFAEDPAGYLDWRLANYPEYAVPPVLVYTTSDYGATFTKVARRESTNNEDLRDMVVAANGTILVAAGLDVYKVNESAKTLDSFAFSGKLVYGLDRDGTGNLYAHGATIGVQRSKDNGASWSQLSATPLNRYAQWVVNAAGGTLTVLGSDGKLYFSQDGGDQFQSIALPTGTVANFANFGRNFYVVLDDGSLFVSRDASPTWEKATPPSAVQRVTTLPNGDVIIATDPVALTVGFAHRSKDAGKTWSRERGAHNDGRLEFATGSSEQAMMVTTRGIFRYSTGKTLDLGTALPPIGNGQSGTGGTVGVGGAASVGGNTSVELSDPGTGNRSPVLGSPADSSGCGCRIPASKRSRGLHAALVTLLLIGGRALRRSRWQPRARVAS